MVNTPIPHSLKSEAKKAAKILREFTIPSARSGPDKLIPVGIFAKAKGLAIITVFKAGFLVTARGGSGIVIAKIHDSLDFASGWSAPSAIGMAGLGGGFELGMEVTDFVIILNTRSAVEAFSKGGNLTLGGNFTIAAGPLGRNIEGDIAVRSPAAIYTYSKTKGIFAGISVEGSALIERKDANKKFYGRPIRASQILNGEVDIPDECHDLYKVMRDHQEIAAKAVLGMAKDKIREGVSKSEWNLSSFKSMTSSRSSYSSQSSTSYGETSASQQSYQSSSSSYSPSSKTKRASLSSMLPSFSREKKKSDTRKSSSSATSYSLRQRRGSDGFEQSPSKPALSSYELRDSHRSKLRSEDRSKKSCSMMALHTHNDNVDDTDDGNGLFVIADYSFQGQLACDLSFQAGEKLLVTWHSGNSNDWWEGITRGGQQGIFPANYCHLVES